MIEVYIDENLPVQLAEGLNILEQPNCDNIVVKSIKVEFGKGAPDEKWIPEIGKRNGIVITQDYNIYRTRAQRDLYIANNVGIIFFKGPKNRGYSYWELVEQLIKKWKEIKKTISKTPRPFALRVTPRSAKIEKL